MAAALFARSHAAAARSLFPRGAWGAAQARGAIEAAASSLAGKIAVAKQGAACWLLDGNLGAGAARAAAFGCGGLALLAGLDSGTVPALESCSSSSSQDLARGAAGCGAALLVLAAGLLQKPEWVDTVADWAWPRKEGQPARTARISYTVCIYLGRHKPCK